MQVLIDCSRIPPSVLSVASALAKAGGKAYLVGGAVRDMMLGLDPSDWDVATDLHPDEVLRVFPDAVTVGVEFGRVSVAGVDVVSLRSESGYQDLRHPSDVKFGVSLEADLARRDFTINAIAVDPFTGEVFDPFGGARDLAARTIRTVGDPRARFGEDALRVLRALRLKCTLGFNLHSDTAIALKDAAHLLSGISGERVFVEFRKILTCASVYEGVMDLWSYGVGKVILPSAFSSEPSRKALACAACSPDLVSRLAAFFCADSRDREDARKAASAGLGKLRVAGQIRRDVEWVIDQVYNSEKLLTGESPASLETRYFARKMIYHFGEEQLLKLLDVKAALWRASGDSKVPTGLAVLMGAYRDILPEKGPYGWRFGELCLTGNDIVESFGLQPGPEVGRLLDRALEAILRDPTVNEREALLTKVRMWLQEGV